MMLGEKARTAVDRCLLKKTDVVLLPLVIWEMKGVCYSRTENGPDAGPDVVPCSALPWIGWWCVSKPFV